MKGKTVVQEKSGRFLIASHGTENPPDAEWDALLKEYGEWPRGEDVRVIVTSEGGAPTAAQRARLTAIMKRRRMLVALLTASTFIGANRAEFATLEPRILQLQAAWRPPT